MSIPALTFGTGLSFLFLFILFRPLELAFPAKPGQKFFRPHWFVDLCFFLGQYLLFGGLVFWLLVRFDSRLSSILPEGFRAAVGGQPWWAPRRLKWSC